MDTYFQKCAARLQSYHEKRQTRIREYKEKAAQRVEQSREKIRANYDFYCAKKQAELDAAKAAFKARKPARS